MKILTILLVTILSISNAFAAPKIKVSGKFNLLEDAPISNLDGYYVSLMENDGSFTKKRLASNGKFNFRIKKNKLAGANIFLSTPEGAYYGQTLLRRNTNDASGNMYFSGKTVKKSDKIALGTINIAQNYAYLARAAKRKVIQANRILALDENDAPIGGGNLGYVAASVQNSQTNSIKIFNEEDAGGDLDGDGVPNVLDSDDNGDLIMDYADPESAQTTARGSLYTSLYLEMSETLNDNVGSGLTVNDINAVMEGANKFAFGLFQGFGANTNIVSGHFECDSALAYCNPDGSDSVYSGFVESDPDNINQPWFDFNTDGNPYNIEVLTERSAFIAGVQPRATLAEFVPGQLMTVALNTGSSTLRKPVVVGPYFVSIPALKSYDAGFGDVQVDYSNAFEPGKNMGNPIVLSGAKTLRLTFWRPQRIGIGGAGEGEFIDMGRLNYGVLFNGLSSEFTCAGFFSSLSSTVTENPDALGEGGSPNSSAGALLWPIMDSSLDAEVDPTNTISFTVDIGQCLTRAGQSTTGNKSINLTAAGEDLGGGSSRAAQMIYLQLP